MKLLQKLQKGNRIKFWLADGIKFDSEIIEIGEDYLEILDLRDKVKRVIPLNSISNIELNYTNNENETRKPIR